MRIGLHLGTAASLAAVGIVLACGPSTAPSAPPDSSTYSDYFTTVLVACNATGGLPASELARIQSRFEQLCESTIALPGLTGGSEELQGCISAVNTSGCAVTQQSAGPCGTFSGTLGGGAACVTDAQCESDSCSAQTEPSDGGTPSGCGTCVAATPLGGSCASGGCVQGAACNPGESGPVCVATTSGAAGATCNGETTLCNAGLVCNFSTMTCAAPGAVGAACADFTDCQSPLVCRQMIGDAGEILGGTCQAAAASGSPCQSTGDCATGLLCGSAGTCVTASWASSGQPCSPQAPCLVGQCATVGETDGGTCPAVVPDGQPCTEQSTCDTFATCLGGQCVLSYAGLCP